MAKKKPRTPPPPRRVQAPTTRSSRSTSGGIPIGDLGMRQRAILYGVAGSGIVALVVVVLIVAFGGGAGGAKAAVTAITNAGCTFKTYPALSRSQHYATPTPKPAPSWNSFPPTSGRHYYQPLIFGIYTEPVQEIRAAHNLEHGAVVLQYGRNVSAADVAKITDWYRTDANAIVVAPLPKLGNKVALTAWKRWTECTGFDEKAANAFRKAFRYQAPEKLPPSSLNPGE